MTTSVTTALLRGITHSGDKMKSQVQGTVLIAIVRLVPGGTLISHTLKSSLAACALSK